MDHEQALSRPSLKTVLRMPVNRELNPEQSDLVGRINALEGIKSQRGARSFDHFAFYRPIGSAPIAAIEVDPMFDKIADFASFLRAHGIPHRGAYCLVSIKNEKVLAQMANKICIQFYMKGQNPYYAARG